jgi:hypothetical protein
MKAEEDNGEGSVEFDGKDMFVFAVALGSHGWSPRDEFTSRCSPRL